ncbi:LacI family DNA-binding transcriptional regulator [Brachybacterium vulturis]|uniref:LacI family DNA-binding transcriptional regulator n=1 Tax=Brachybacterium vulturis TaxID=2017484 RepID=UPI00156188C0|nr:LacI family DNA-binding transcriptional regulator [Brachybacterium vulturis]
MARSNRNDVARRAGVAPSTVSNVLNGRAAALRIADTTAERVRRAAHELGYIPQASARSLRSGGSSTIGLMLAPLPPSPFVPIVHEVVTAAITGTQRRGKLVLPFADPGEGGEDTAYVDRVMADVDLAGVICELSAHNLAAGRRLHQLDVPVVWMSLAPTAQRPPGIAHVMVDQAAGWAPLLDSLEIEDDKEIAMLVGPMFRPARLDLVAERFPGRTRLLEASSWLPDGGAQAVHQLLADRADIGAIVCADDSLAHGAMLALRDEGIDVPGEISVVGFGGWEEPVTGVGTLATASWPVRALTESAVGTLLDHLEGVHRRELAAEAPVTEVLAGIPLPGPSARLGRASAMRAE